MTPRTLLLSLLVGLSLAIPAHAQGFKFSDEDATEKAEEAEKIAKINSLLSTPCRAKIKNQKIMVLIGESRNGLINARNHDQRRALAGLVDVVHFPVRGGVGRGVGLLGCGRARGGRGVAEGRLGQRRVAKGGQRQYGQQGCVLQGVKCLLHGGVSARTG